MDLLPKPAYLTLFTFFYAFLPLAFCSSRQETNESLRSNTETTKDQIHRMSPEIISYITLHGFLLWASMGFLMPIGILIIRISSREEAGSNRSRVLFYLHVTFQICSVLLATIDAAMSINKLENSFNNSHQKIGIALNVAILVQALIGFFRPKRGKKERSCWYLVHWILGTMISLAGIINIYTGLEAYHKKTSKSTSLWTILFTIEILFLAFIYLFQDKLEYIHKQAMASRSELPIITSSTNDNIVNNQDIPPHIHKELLPQPCGKHNALKNLFD